MEADKRTGLSRGDFPFSCHFKVRSYMSGSQFAATCDRNWHGCTSAKWLFQEMRVRASNEKLEGKSETSLRAKRNSSSYLGNLLGQDPSRSCSLSLSLISQCHWQRLEQQHLGYLLCLLLISRWSDAESNNNVRDKQRIMFSFNVQNPLLRSLFVPEAYFRLH